MATQDDDTPEKLDELRSTVQDWVTKARKAVWSFNHDGGSFWRDTEQFRELKTTLSPTATARCFSALIATERCAHTEDTSPVETVQWINQLREFLSKPRFTTTSGVFAEYREEGLPPEFNVFEQAHLAEFVLANKFINRFSKEDSGPFKLVRGSDLREFQDTLIKALTGALRDSNNSESGETSRGVGEIYFDKDKTDSRHFFVTLHVLRALSMLEPETCIESSLLRKITNAAEALCIRQCFYSQRRTPHRRDPYRLIFAGVIYCLYAKEVDKELCIAVIETIDAMQQENGSWPATYPIQRAEKPWYITSHEIPLCLTWLYFEPRLPDESRHLLLKMMRAYFENWLIPTFVQREYKQETESGGQKAFDGWYDDHSIGRDIVVGWATAIACNFLANYQIVLGDHINRRVIKSLEIGSFAQHYAIDETSNDRARSIRWRRERPGDDGAWFDLPPYAWSPPREPAEVGEEIARNWTDPTQGAELSMKLAHDVLCPILDSPAQRPSSIACAGVLPGVPGTRKTSLVKTLAKEMRWPLVCVPASVIFELGFDQMETRATEVFRRLNMLTGCVIFFDEFEEFFRDRKVAGRKVAPDEEQTDDSKRRVQVDVVSVPVADWIHDRTIAAFTTSAMLPRLQDLRDEHGCVIFLATNHIDRLDEAIIRVGRFDFLESVNHPSLRRLFEGERCYLNELSDRTFNEVTQILRGRSDWKRRLANIKRAMREAFENRALLESLIEIQCRWTDDEEKIRELKAVLASSNNRRRWMEKTRELVVTFDVFEKALRQVARVARSSYNIRILRRESINAIAAQIDKQPERGPPSLGSSIGAEA